MPTRIASMDVRAEHVPDDVVVSAEEGDDGDQRVAGLPPVVAFAQTFNGYAYGGAPHQLGGVVDTIHRAWRDGEGLPTDLDRLRACLFYWARAHRHDDATITADDADWLNALLAAIRQRLADRD